MSLFHYVLVEYDPEQPWIVISRERRTAELDESEDFQEWARRAWPEPQWRVELDPGQEPRLMQ
jgi:hypothetical protein